MTSVVNNSQSKDIVAYSFPQKEALRLQPPASCASLTAEITAVSVEFVAKPQETRRVEAAIPAAIASALKYVSGFTGCLVMISEQEARLVTVVTLWDGDDSPKRCSQHVQCVTALLTPYFDCCLRVQTMVAHLPAVPLVRLTTIDAGGRPVDVGPLTEGDTACVA